jgi:hypothetical protein
MCKIMNENMTLEDKLEKVREANKQLEIRLAELKKFNAELKDFILKKNIK